MESISKKELEELRARLDAIDKKTKETIVKEPSKVIEGAKTVVFATADVALSGIEKVSSLGTRFKNLLENRAQHYKARK